MDKELLRIVIIATGLLIMIGMVLWSYLNARQQDNDETDIPHEKAIGSKGVIDESLRMHPEHDEFDIIPIGSANAQTTEANDDWAREMTADFDDDDEDFDLDERPSLPEVLQFAVIAQTEDGFNGTEIASALTRAGLEYGSLKVFERINEQGQVDYGVACMLQPGTFPDGEALVGFQCPGIVFYLQHGDLENAQSVFDDFIDTIQTVADELDGDIWDHQRQPLTPSTIQFIRQSL
jgi:cell division protein ZipA